MMATASPFSLASQHIDEFKGILGEKYVFIDDESLYNYSHDETEDFHFLPDVVLKPRTAEEISAILKICNQYKIPVTPRGAGTGLSGGALPHLGGVLLSTERMNRILDIDERNLQVTTEPGIITEGSSNGIKRKRFVLSS
jgi:glycolate oxidase